MTELERHYREQITTLHQRCDALQGALVFFSDRQSHYEESMRQLRAQLAELAPKPSCSLCRGEGCTLSSCGRAATSPAP